ncbi:hypothetical protein BD410DRAFT_810569 [Rickenella mellea]|uniref:Uncharacterized protein n=1 Tax=Rickenella mellea TaxID=50990 RepID=A0A4Y7PDU6_9AGAM|nr:hypothetical protein BD410DRAFT_810569 [Rickenella mellea]
MPSTPPCRPASTFHHQNARPPQLLLTIFRYDNLLKMISTKKLRVDPTCGEKKESNYVAGTDTAQAQQSHKSPTTPYVQSPICADNILPDVTIVHTYLSALQSAIAVVHLRQDVIADNVILSYSCTASKTPLIFSEIRPTSPQSPSSQKYSQSSPAYSPESPTCCENFRILTNLKYNDLSTKAPASPAYIECPVISPIVPANIGRAYIAGIVPFQPGGLSERVERA